MPTFPTIIIDAIEAAADCDAAPIHYGVSYGLTDDAEPTASMGRLSGGLEVHGVADDFVVGTQGGLWVVWSDDDMSEPLGTFVDAAGLQAGLGAAIATRYATKGAARRALEDSMLTA